MTQGRKMKYSMIRYNKVIAGIEWFVVRGGKVITNGVASSFELAKEEAENSLIKYLNADKIETKVLMGVGEKRLSLISH